MNTSQQRTPEAWERESTWLSLAIAGGVLIGVGVAAVLVWIGGADDDTARQVRVQIAAPFGVVAIAAVTFFTVVWRGLISARQANTSIDQLQGLRKQIELTEENNLAALLQKGAELIADSNPAKVSAGIASLEAVAADSPRFYGAAMRLLVDYVCSNGQRSHLPPLVKQAILGLRRANEKHGYVVDNELYFTGDGEADEDVFSSEWMVIRGVVGVIYRFGEFRFQHFSAKEKYSGLFFNQVDFYRCTIDDISDLDSHSCTFKNCVIRGADAEDLKRHKFVRCDFTNAKLPAASAVPDLRKGENYYVLPHPPTGDGDTNGADWDELLFGHDEQPEFAL
ncbi:hypothetical protein [Aminobacter niigataensis]|uniref:hypothetical protein n=1 Tax=Aminobacter niigataensis TaxID=83265 RepID=UPI0024C9C9AE|nr:hypothetical protein [Aminobacter niigataensis]CAI2936138.1 conserved protein of unknown function [Aminobacter niigataensis]